MMDIKESTKKSPAGELTPAPTQGNGPAWEGKSLSDGVVEDRAAAVCQESAELSDKSAKRLPPGAEAPRAPTRSIEVVNDNLEPRVFSPSLSSTKNTSTCLVDQCRLNTIQNAGDKGGITTLRPPETSCITKSAEEGTATPCGGLGHTDDRGVEQNVDQYDATFEQSLGQGSLTGFQELLQEVMRQSDAERAQDRESARNFRRVRQPSPLEQQQVSVDQPIINTPAETQLPTTASSSASIRSEAECIRADVVVERTDSTLSSLALAATPQPDVVKPVVVERRWMRYLSPEGYPYLYDEVTGESEWVGSGEEGAQSPQTEEPTRDATTTSGEMYGEPGDTGHALGEQDESKDLLDTAGIEAGERNTMAYPAGDKSVGTCGISQWSQGTSVPDARNSAGETAMHLAAAQHSPRGIGLLLANGASVNARDYGGRTPLHAACASCHDHSSRGGGDSDLALLESIELLLSSGAPEDTRDAKGQTALHLSALAGSLSAARALLAGGATIVADDAGNSPLHLAAAQGHSDIIQLLVVGDQGEPPPRKPPASTFSEAETRAHCRPRAAIGELQSVVDDKGLSAHERGPGAVLVGRQESETASTMTHGEALGDDHVAARMAAAPGQHFGGTGGPTEEKISISSREFHSRYNEPGVSSFADGPTASVGNGYSWGGPATSHSVPNGQSHPLEPQNVHDNARSRWQGGDDAYKGSVENSIQNADRISEDDSVRRRGHRAVEAEHHRRRPKGSRLRLSSRQRHESARDDRDHGHDRTLGWPEALPSNEYEQIIGATFAGEGESGSRAPSRSALSTALFAACLASQSSDAAAALHLLKMHGDGIGDVRDESGRTPLHHVCRADDVGVARLLCQAGADAAAQDSRGNSPLMVAAATGSLACLQLLVQQGSDLDCSNDDGDTPLHVAVRHGNLSCVKILVEGGAWLSQRNTQGFTPREDILNAKPMFTRGRLPKVLRATLEYIERAEPNSPTWTAHDGEHDGYGSEATAASAAPRHNLTDYKHKHHHHYRRDSLEQPSSGRGGQQLATTGGIAWPDDQPRHVQGSTRTSITEGGEREQDWEPRGWELEGGRDVVDGRSEGRSEGGLSSGGGRPGGGWNNKRQPTERRANSGTESESRDNPDEEPPPDSNSGVPSRLRTGVWSVVGRVIDSLIGGGNGGSDGAQNLSGSEAESDGSAQDTIEHRRPRPPTDAELRATVTMRTAASPSSSSKSGPKRTPGAGRLVGETGSSAAESEPPPTTVKVPISLTPMQPPPDVLAAMKGRAASGRRRPRFSAPPNDVAAALEKTREANSRGHKHDNAVDHVSTRYIQYQQPQRQHDTGAKQELGPFSLSASGGLGKQGGRSARSMYIDYLDECKRVHVHGTDGDGV